jgi:DNA-binding MarR family transcriptional regulator
MGAGQSGPSQRSSVQAVRHATFIRAWRPGFAAVGGMSVPRAMTSLLDEMMVRETYKVQLTPEDALVLGWIVEQPGISCARIAERVGRQRHSVQRSLMRLKRRGVLEGYQSPGERTHGWGLSERGHEIWEGLSRGFELQDRQLERSGANLRQWVIALEDLMRAVYVVTRATTWGQPMVIPPEEPEISDWDH